MKFDKDIVIAIAISLVIIFGWGPLCSYFGWFQVAPPATVVEESAAEPEVVPAAEAGTGESGAQVAVAAEAEKIAELPPGPVVGLANELMGLSIDAGRGGIESVTMFKYLNAARTGQVVLDRAGGDFGALGVFSLAHEWRPVRLVRSESSGDELAVVREFRNEAGQSFLLTQRFSLSASSYVVNCAYTFTNPGTAPLRVDDLVVGGGNLAPWAVISGDRVRIPSHRLDYLTADGSYADIKASRSEEKFFVRPAPLVDWAAVGNKYFCTILDGDKPYTLWQGRYTLPGTQTAPEHTVISVGAALPGETLASGGSVNFEFELYTGPKIIADLDGFNPTTGTVMHLAWGPLDYLARLLLWILVKLHAVTDSYGVSIILLTLLVRILFFPVTAKANASMKRMQEFQPKIKELREKYKDNPQLMNTKMMELYRAEGINPFGGCLPILLQIPVFFALYATLDGAVELRQESFLWCTDLAAADTVARINLYFFTLPLNPLVLAMTGLMILQQHLQPMSADPMQRRMMAFMPIVMLFFFYDLPSGLTLYWTVSNIFSIIQLLLLRRSSLPKAGASPAAATSGTSKKGN